MTPKTKVQKEIVALYAKMQPLTERQKAWAMENATANIGFLNKNHVWCTECGSWTPCSAEEGTEYVCPHCGRKLKICKSRRLTYENKQYVTYVTTKGRFQVLRHFILRQNCYSGMESAITLNEAVQEWIEPSGDIHYVARKRYFCNYYVDNWIFSQDMELRNADGYSVYAYQVYANYIYPYMKVLPILRRNGFKSSFHGVTPSLLFMALLGKYPQAEWLLKSKQYGFLSYYLDCHGLPFKDSVKICIRNGYKVKNVEIWNDYLEALNYFHMDLHNAHYVCPKNLKQAHDYWVKRMDKAEKKRKAEERLKEAAQWEQQYAKDKGKFIGIAFGVPGINISVLPSVAAFVDEAEHMHHCVYANEYYKKPESLILSAKDDKGKRLETIEVNLKTFQIVQCYGACNQFTPQHEKILEVMNKNMNLIRQAV